MDPTSKTLRCVRLNPTSTDPALDVAAMSAPAEGDTVSRAGRYVMTRDESLLVFRADAPPPTWFNLRRLSAAWMTDILDGLFSASSQRVLAFRAACHSIEAAEPLSVASHGTKSARFVAGDANHGVSLAPEEWVQEIAEIYGLETVHEIGRVAIDFSRLPRGARGPFGFWGGSVASL
jgi:hypothetical protein